MADEMKVEIDLHENAVYVVKQGYFRRGSIDYSISNTIIYHHILVIRVDVRW